jgi:hypothetical protein
VPRHPRALPGLGVDQLLEVDEDLPRRLRGNTSHVLSHLTADEHILPFVTRPDH